MARGCHARRPAAPPPPAPPRPQRTIPAHVAPCASHAPSPGLFFVPARPPQFPCPFWQPPCCSFSLSLPLASAPPPPQAPYSTHPCYPHNTATSRSARSIHAPPHGSHQRNPSIGFVRGRAAANAGCAPSPRPLLTARPPPPPPPRPMWRSIQPFFPPGAPPSAPLPASPSRRRPRGAASAPAPAHRTNNNNNNSSCPPTKSFACHLWRSPMRRPSPAFPMNEAMPAMPP